MALAPVRSGSDFNQVKLSFASGESAKATSLENIDAQVVMGDVIHDVQSTEAQLRGYVTDIPVKGTFRWRNVTPHRDPLARNQAVPDINARKQTFTKFGITLNPYDDDYYLVDYVTENADMDVPGAILKASEMGFERLYDRVAITAMLEKVRAQTSSSWALGQKTTSEVSLPVDRIVAKTDATGAPQIPDLKTWLRCRRKFYDNNVSRSYKLYGLLTPRLEEIILNTAEAKNRDYIYSLMQNPDEKVVKFAGFNFVKVGTDVAPGAWGASYYLPAQESVLSDATDTSAGNYDLTPSNHEAIPLWIKENVFVGHNKKLDLFHAFLLPSKRMTPTIIRTKWCGGSRAINKKQLVLIIPV